MQNEIIRLSRTWSKYRQFWDFIEQQEQNHPDFVIPDEFYFFFDWDRWLGLLHSTLYTKFSASLWIILIFHWTAAFI